MTEHKVRIKIVPAKETKEFQVFMGETKEILAARLCKIELSLLPDLKRPLPLVHWESSVDFQGGIPIVSKGAEIADLRAALEQGSVEIRVSQLILEGMLKNANPTNITITEEITDEEEPEG